MLKTEIRKEYKEKRLALPENEQVRLDDLMLITFQTHELPFIHSLLSYWPIEQNREPATHLFTGYLEFKNPALRVLYPRADFKTGTMQAILVNADTPFIENDYQIHEPADGLVVFAEEVDMVFVPLLAIDQSGYRVGYGRGFYDRYLAKCRPDCFKIGFSYFAPVDKIDDRDEFDIPLDICITPDNVYVF